MSGHVSFGVGSTGQTHGQDIQETNCVQSQKTQTLRFQTGCLVYLSQACSGDNSKKQQQKHDLSHKSKLCHVLACNQQLAARFLEVFGGFSAPASDDEMRSAASNSYK